MFGWPTAAATPAAIRTASLGMMSPQISTAVSE